MSHVHRPHLSRRRRRARGAVFVEALAVVAFFALCFLAVLFFRDVYGAKLRVQRLARASAMSHAMGACQGEPGAGLEKDLPRSPPPRGPEPGPAPAFDTGGKRDADEALHGLARATAAGGVTVITLTTAASAKTVDAATHRTWGFQTDVSSASYVTCGDPVSDEQYGAIVPHLEGVFAKYF
jgi:hypothetical protein